MFDFDGKQAKRPRRDEVDFRAAACAVVVPCAPGQAGKLGAADDLLDYKRLERGAHSGILVKQIV